MTKNCYWKTGKGQRERGGRGLTVKGRDVNHAYITYTQQFLHTHHASTGPFFCLFQYHIIRNNHNWVKNCRKHFSFKKKRGHATKWVITLNAIKKKEEEEYSWSHTENSWQTSHTFWAINISEKPVKALAFLSHGSVTALSAKVPPPLLLFWSKHGVNRIPWRVWWAGQECTTLHTNWSQSREKYWQATVATGLGQPHCSHSRL